VSTVFREARPERPGTAAYKPDNQQALLCVWNAASAVITGKVNFPSRVTGNGENVAVGRVCETGFHQSRVVWCMRETACAVGQDVFSHSDYADITPRCHDAIAISFSLRHYYFAFIIITILPLRFH